MFIKIFGDLKITTFCMTVEKWIASVLFYGVFNTQINEILKP